jgi:hypothetical protein
MQTTDDAKRNRRGPAIAAPAPFGRDAGDLGESDGPVPLAVGFPSTAWTTRPSEMGTWAGVGEGPSAPQDRASPAGQDV